MATLLNNPPPHFDITADKYSPSACTGPTARRCNHEVEYETRNSSYSRLFRYARFDLCLVTESMPASIECFQADSKVGES